MKDDNNIAPGILDLLTKQTEAHSDKTTMSVREMADMLGLGKTESYWLVNKRFFKTVQISGRTRVDIRSFNLWYDNQVKYHIVGGRPPGSQLKATSYSAADIGQILGISESYAYDLIKREELPVITVDYWRRVPKKAFDKWYESQSHFRDKEDRERDAAAEAASITMPEMARMLGVPRRSIYSLVRSKKAGEMLEFIEVGGRKRITRESFEKWYAGQEHFQKKKVPQAAPTARPRESGSSNPNGYTVREAAEKYGLPVGKVYKWIREGKVRTTQDGRMKLLPKKAFDRWMRSHV